MDRLPLELCNAVCRLLPVDEILQLRLVSRYSHQVATPFFPSEIHLIFTLKSFEKLLDVSRHPVISLQMRSIFYEADTLELVDRRCWEQQFTTPEYSPGELDQAWAQYQQFYRDQIELCRQRYGIRELQEALTRLPNVKTFRLSMAHNLEPRSKYLESVFSAGFRVPFGDDRREHAAGVPQLRSVLLSMHEARIKLQSFECGDVSWRLFRCSKTDLKAFATTLSHVRRMKLQISTGMDASGNEFGVDLPECRRFLRNGRMRDLITQARYVEYLEINFASSTPVFGIELGNIVGTQTFPKLASVRFSNVETNEEELMIFLQRHKLTLRSLHLDTICLASGAWTTMVPSIRSSLQLDDFNVEGNLFSDHPRQEFDLGMIGWDDSYLPGHRRGIEKRKAIQEWFNKGGACPFTDGWSKV